MCDSTYNSYVDTPSPDTELVNMLITLNHTNISSNFTDSIIEYAALDETVNIPLNTIMSTNNPTVHTLSSPDTELVNMVNPLDHTHISSDDTDSLIEADTLDKPVNTPFHT